MATTEIINKNFVEPTGNFRVAVLCKDDTGAVNSGLSPIFLLYRFLDGKWWNETNEAWEGAVVVNSLTEVDAAQIPGVYSAAISMNNVTPNFSLTDMVLYVQDDAVAPTSFSAGILHPVWGFLSAGVFDTEIANPVDTFPKLLTALRAFLTHNQEINDDNKQLVIYKENGEDPAIAFNLKDAAGLPSGREPFSKERV